MKTKLLTILLFLTSIFAKANVGGSITVRAFLDANCNKIADKEELISTVFTATVIGRNYNITKQSGISNPVFNALNFETYTASASFNVNKNGTTKTLTNSTSVTITSVENQMVDILLADCDIVITPTEPIETLLPNDLCGTWKNAIIEVSNTLQVSGNNQLNYSREPLIIGLLKTKVSFKGSNKWVFEKRTGNCTITGTIVKPNGTKTEFTNNFDFAIMLPGIYTISYTVKCMDKICETGVKIINCTDVIVCNCGPVNNNIIVTSKIGKAKTHLVIKNGDSVLIDKNAKYWLDYTINCEGNICDGLANYTLENIFGNIINKGSLGNINWNAINGNYILKINGFCGGKQCATLQFPVRLFGEKIRKIINEDVHSRWGNQIDVHLGFPQIHHFKTSNNYVRGLFGFIGDVPFGVNKHWHWWPALNIASVKYEGLDRYTSFGLQETKVQYKQLQLRFANDLSYAIRVGKKSQLHFYVGASMDYGVCRKLTITDVPYVSVSPWINANKSDKEQLPNINFNAGLLYDINRTWTVGLNYFKYNKLENKEVYPSLIDQGIALRLAWFYNQKRN